MSDCFHDFVNPEQLLEFGFELLSDDHESTMGRNIIGWYVIHSDPSILDDEERLEKEIRCLIVRGTLRNLVEMGLMAFDFETDKYSLTRYGKAVERSGRPKRKQSKKK